MLLAKGADINAKDSSQRTLLHRLAWASNSGLYDPDPGMLDIVLQHTLDVYTEDIDGLTPFHEAFYGGKLDLVQRLLGRHHNLESSPVALSFVRLGAIHLPLRDIGQRLSIRF
ncbi:hypothetical protein BDW74DRAFT_156757 [Aspergillus multicolor]|uniref:uncharacterized protein n=1 Tax=Aspergillus multicolor TaxID=41759 RepID=UPI003CCD5C95